MHFAPVAESTRTANGTWSVDALFALFELPFNEHRAHLDPAEVELATLLSIKTGGCPEDCSYCPQAARQTRDRGATRFCMGAAWRSPKARVRLSAGRREFNFLWRQVAHDGQSGCRRR